MLKLSSSLVNIPIISLRTAGQIGLAVKPLINPNNLKIEGWMALSQYASGHLILPISDIREISRFGMAVNDEDAITPADELVRLRPIIQLNFQLVGKLVVTEGKKKLGKIETYAVDLESFFIQKMYVTPTMLKAFTKDQIQISRSQIVEITDKKVIVRDLEVTERAFFTAPAQAQ